jgi:hypothetical protein
MTSEVATTVWAVIRATAVAVAVVTASACSGSSPSDSRTDVYAACREAVFHNDQGLEPEGRGSVVWPEAGSPSVSFHRTSNTYAVTIRHVTVDAGGQNSNAIVDCMAKQDAGGHWRATASVES